MTITPLYRVNSGGPAIADGTLDWHRDDVGSRSPWTVATGDHITTLPAVPGSTVPPDVPLSMFDTLRWRVSGQFGYSFPRDSGGGFRLRLFFAERNNIGVGGRRFHIDVDGVRRYVNFDIWAQAPGRRVAVMVEIPLAYENAGPTTVDLVTGAADTPIICGVELARTTGPGPGPSDPLDTVFVGIADGGLWPAPWQTELVGGSGGGAHDVQAGRGRQQTNDGPWNVARAVAAIHTGNVRLATGFRVPSGGSWADRADTWADLADTWADLADTWADLADTWADLPDTWADLAGDTWPGIFGEAEQYGTFFVRASGWNASAPWEVTDGYGLQVGPDGLDLFRYVAGVRTSLGTKPQSWAADTDYSAILEAEGSTVRAKVWAVGSWEPSGWGVTAVDGTHASGDVRVSLLGGGTTGGRRWDLRHFTVTDPGVVPPPAVGPSLWFGDGRPAYLYLAKQLVGPAA